MGVVRDFDFTLHISHSVRRLVFILFAFNLVVVFVQSRLRLHLHLHLRVWRILSILCFVHSLFHFLSIIDQSLCFNSFPPGLLFDIYDQFHYFRSSPLCLARVSSSLLEHTSFPHLQHFSQGATLDIHSRIGPGHHCRRGKREPSFRRIGEDFLLVLEQIEW